MTKNDKEQKLLLTTKELSQLIQIKPAVIQKARISGTPAAFSRYSVKIGRQIRFSPKLIDMLFQYTDSANEKMGGV